MSPAPTLIPVPEEVSRTAAAALLRRQELQGGGSARGVVIATALSTGHVRPWELAELKDWHDAHPDDVQGEATTLLGGMYGGAPARLVDWEGAPERYEPATAALRSPLRDRLAKLSATLNDTDRKLRLRLHAASEVAFKEAVRQANGKLYARARTKAQKAMVASASALTPAILAAVGVTEQELLDKRFDELGTSATAWILMGERRKLRATATALGLDPGQLEEEYGEELDRRATEASGFLIAGLGILARSVLSGRQPPTKGELSGPVPFGLIRDTMTIGTSRTTAPPLLERGVGPADIDAISARLDRTGETIAEELLAREGIETQTTKTWVHGDPQRDFEPHLLLDGQSWVGDDYPPDMLADSGEWPYVDVYEPGDHDYCTCELIEDVSPSLPDEGLNPDPELRATARDAILAQPGPADIVDLLNA